MQCHVCLSPEGGHHYQTICCRACAAFWKRTNLLKIKYVCSKVGNCSITYENRYSCRSCRMKYCIKAGMVWYDDESASTDFRDDPRNEVSDVESKINEMDLFYSEDNVFGEYDEFYGKLRKRIDVKLSKKFNKSEFPFEMSICNQISIVYSTLAERWLRPNENADKDPKFSVVLCNLLKGVEQGAEMCMTIRQFVELPFNQRNIVYTHFMMRFPQVFRTFTTVDYFGHEVSENILVTQHGILFDIIKNEMNIGEVANCHADEVRRIMTTTFRIANKLFVLPYKKFKADEFEKGFILGCSMWNFKAVTPDLKEIGKQITNRIFEELCFYYKHEKKVENYAERLYKLQNILTGLDKVAEIRKRDRQVYATFKLFKTEIYVTEIVEKTEED